MLVCGVLSVSYGFRSLRLTSLFSPIASTFDRPLSKAKPLVELLVVDELVLLPVPARLDNS
ncbi:hypothetical protein D3C78_1962440 [compost metagenome]